MCFKRFKINRINKKIKSLQQSRLHNPAHDDAIKKELALYHKLAKIYESLKGHKKYPFAQEMVLECYRAASTLEDANAQYHLGQALLEEAKFRDNLQTQGVFVSTSNERQSKQLYEEALAYLLAAVQLNHIQAKRLYGLCYIHGWGLPADKKRGFDLIVESIEAENSWDKVPQIFAQIGLNKPEFFSALTEHRSKN